MFGHGAGQSDFVESNCILILLFFSKKSNQTANINCVLRCWNRKLSHTFYATNQKKDANDDNFLFFGWTIPLRNLTYTLKVILKKLSRNESSHGLWVYYALFWFFCCVCYHQSLTWPLNLIGVAQVVWGGDKHFSISDWWPERDHVELSVVTNRSIFLRIGHCSCCISTVNPG